MTLAAALASTVTLGLVSMMTDLVMVTGAMRTGIPQFDQQIVLDAEHRLVIHYGSHPTCLSIPNPPQHDCFWLGSERHEFSADYLTPTGVQSLLRFRLPTA